MDTTNYMVVLVVVGTMKAIMMKMIRTTRGCSSSSSSSSMELGMGDNLAAV